jgi:hypothetical protein
MLHFPKNQINYKYILKWEVWVFPGDAAEDSNLLGCEAVQITFTLLLLDYPEHGHKKLLRNFAVYVYVPTFRSLESTF